jgi:hypothetical protein
VLAISYCALPPTITPGIRCRNISLAVDNLKDQARDPGQVQMS